MVVQDRREQVVRGGDRVEVAGQVQLSIHGHDLAVAATGGAALDPERRAHRRCRIATVACRPIPHSACPGRPCGGLALAQRRRRDRGDDRTRLRPVRELVDRRQLDLATFSP
jgi:hypothetical protein